MDITIAALQFDVYPGRVDKNLSLIKKYIRYCVEAGSGATIGENPFNEMFNQKSSDHKLFNTVTENCNDLDVLLLPEYFSGALPGDNNYNEEIIAFVTDLSVYLDTTVCGSTLWEEKPGLYSNKCLICDPNKGIIGTSSKQRPFKSELNINFQKGDEFGIFQVNDFRIGVSICNDTWWPISYRKGLKDCDVVLIPVMSSVENQAMIDYGRLTWWNLAMTRSKENIHYIVVADHAAGTKRMNSGRLFSTCGASIITNPCSRNVNDMARVIKHGSKGLLKVKFDKESLIEYRNYRKSAGMY